MNVDHRFTQTQQQYAADDLETMSEAGRYQAHIFGLVRPYLGRHVLEAGCGIGTMSRRILGVDAQQRLACIEPKVNCASRARLALSGEPRVEIRACDLEECDPLELRQERFDTIVCVNVLEHIEDDVRALTLFQDVVAALGRHRRYSKRSLTRAFAAAGLDLVTIRYTNPIGLLGWMYNLYVSGNSEHTTDQVRLFDRVVAPWALPIERLMQPPIGFSLFAVGRARALAP